MAVRAPKQTGNWNTAATWGTFTNASILTTTTSLAALSTSFIYGAVFTAPSTSDSLERILFPIDTSGANTITGDYDIIMNLEEYDGATWSEVATAQFSTADDFGSLINAEWFGWIGVELTTPYTYTTTTAGYYRLGVKYVANSGAETWYVTTMSGSAALLALDDRSGVPANTDDIIICGVNDTVTTVTVDGTTLCGSGVASPQMHSDAPHYGGLVICHNGKLSWDRTANSSLEVNGALMVRSQGTFDMGSVASPIPQAYTADLIFNTVTYDRNFGIYGPGIVDIHGQSPLTTTTYVGVYSSGVGTAADPMITTTAVDWTVNDEIIVASMGSGATAADEYEVKFIKTKNSSTSYVLADTAGGAESAFTYSHAAADIYNLTRNVTVARKSGSTTKWIAWLNNSGIEPSASPNDLSAYLRHSWARLTGYEDGVELSSGANSVPGANYQMDYCVFSNYERHGFYGTGSFSKSDPVTFNGCFFGLPDSTASQDGIWISGSGFLFTGCYIMATNEEGVFIDGASELTFTDCVFAGNNRDGTSSSGSVTFNGGTYIRFNTCDFYSTPYGINVAAAAASAYKVTFNTCNIAVKGSTLNNADAGFYFGSFNDSAVDVTMLNCTVGATDPSTTEGSSAVPIGWQNIDGVVNKNIVWNRTGSIVTTGSGLADTTVRNGTYAVRLEAKAAIFNHFLEFNIPARASSAVSCLGYIKRNSSHLTGAVTVELYLPGSITPDASTTLSTGTEDWELWSLFADYTGTGDRLATVKINMDFQQTGGYIYIDDIFNGANTFTKFDTWHDGGPVQLMTNELGNPREVWDIVNSGHAVNTMGQLAADLKTNLAVVDALVDDISIKVDDAGLLAILK